MAFIDPLKSKKEFTDPFASKPIDTQSDQTSWEQYIDAQLAKGRPPEAIQAELLGVEANPWVDPISAASAAAGGAVPGVASKFGAGAVGKIAGRAALSGVTAAGTEYPIGQAADIIAGKHPYAATALALATGLASGRFIEAPLEEAAAKAIGRYTARRGGLEMVEAIPRAVGKLSPVRQESLEALSKSTATEAKRQFDIEFEQFAKSKRRAEAGEIKPNPKFVEPLPDASKTAEEITSQATLASGGLPAGGIPSQAGGIKPSSIEGSNIERRLEAKWETTRQHKETAQAIINDYRDYIFAGRRGGEKGVVKTADDIKLANELGLDRSKLGMEIPTGIRLKQLHTAITENVDNIREIANAKLSGQATDTDMARLVALVEETATFKRYLTGELAEWGRAGKMLQQMSRSGETINRFGEFADLTGPDGIFNDKLLKKLVDIKSPQDVDNIFKPNWWDKFFEFYSNSILSNPVTHIVNSTGNSIMVGVKPVDAFAAGVADWARAGIKGEERTRFASEALHQLTALKSGFSSGLKSGLRTFMEFEQGRGLAEARKLEAPQIKQFAIGGPWGKLARGMWRLLSTEDAFFKGIVEQMELHSLAYRNARKLGLSGDALRNKMSQLVAVPTPEMLKQIETEKTFRAYQTPIKGVSKSIAKIRNWELPGTGAKPFQMVLPFITTPINLAKEGLRRTPIGLAKTILTSKGLTPEQFAEDLAKGSMGSAIFGGMILAAANGNITGGGPTDKAERDALYRTGWQPYSIKRGDNYYSYQRIEPFGMILGLAADTYEGAQIASQEESTWKEVAAKAGFGIGRNILSKTYMQGLQETLDAVQEPDRYADKFLQRRISSVAVPQFGSYIAGLDDPYLREINTVMEAVKSRTPGERGKLLPKLDIWGRKIRRDGPLWYRAMIPLYMSTTKGDRVDNELIKIGLFPSPPSRNIAGQRLTDKQYNQYQREAGQASRKAVEQLINTRLYKSASPDVKADLIRKTMNKQRSFVRERLKPQWGM